jgi:DnaJ family protein C protein 7
MKEAEIRFKDIGEAYSVLSDAKKKQMYDEGMDLEEIN